MNKIYGNRNTELLETLELYKTIRNKNSKWFLN